VKEDRDQNIKKIYDYIIKNELIDIEMEEKCWEFDNSNINTSNFDDDAYIWLKYEPEWKQIVKMSKQGDVKKGFLSFSTDISSISLGEFENMIDGKKSVRIRVYNIEIECKRNGA
jgi:hypothetical protein